LESRSKNNLVVFYGGIGDILLWIPALKAFENKPDVIFLYQTPDLKILGQNNLVNKTYSVKNKLQLFLFMSKHRKFYDKLFLNHLCGGDFLLQMMSACTKDLVTNSPNYISSEKNNLIKRKTLDNSHDSVQNYFLVFEKIPNLTASDFKLKIIEQDQISLPASFISVQLSAGNNKTPYKNWPVEQWSVFFEIILNKYPDQKFVFLGHSEEAQLFEKLNIKNDNIISLIGKTSIDQTFNVIGKSDFFIGPDGGLMHVAVACGKPTFTIWGGSSPVLYGYELLLGSEHKVVMQKLACMPCNAWLKPNIGKTKDPLKCPDFACLKVLSANAVAGQFSDFYPENKKANKII